MSWETLSMTCSLTIRLHCIGSNILIQAPFHVHIYTVCSFLCCESFVIPYKHIQATRKDSFNLKVNFKLGHSIPKWGVQIRKFINK